MRRSFTQEFKQGIVKKILLPGGPSIPEMARELSISDPTIRQWVKKDGRAGVMSKSENWSPEKKLQAVVETSNLSEEELGAYLRKHGIHSDDLKNWRKECLQSFRGPGRPRKDPELAASQKERKLLEREVRRKDKALAEFAARVVLLKKRNLLWGVDEDEES